MFLTDSGLPPFTVNWRIGRAERGARGVCFDSKVSKTTAILLLILAASLEAAGDAVVRKGIHASGLVRTVLFAAGAAVLFLYGWTVNRPPWKFGELLGLYVVFFFLVAQAISAVFFHEQPSRPVWVGGAFILVGGLIIASRA